MFNDLIARMPEHSRQRLDHVRHEVHVRSAEGRVRVWDLSTRGLQRAHELLEEAPPTLARPLQRLVDERLRQATALPLTGYDEMNAKTAAHAVRGLGLLDLERVARHERAHKNRKTVNDAIEHERSLLLAEPQIAA